MIQPQELRIGNNVNTELGIAEVIGIYEDVVDVKGVSVIDNSSENKISISTRSFDGCVEYEKIQPIPLTEEIILKFGFEKKGDFWFVKSGIKIENRNNGFSYFRYLNEIKILSVHQLQNLYFALTGEELTQVSEGKIKILYNI